MGVVFDAVSVRGTSGAVAALFCEEVSAECVASPGVSFFIEKMTAAAITIASAVIKPRRCDGFVKSMVKKLIVVSS